MSEFKVKYDGSNIEVLESIGSPGHTTTNVRPVGCNSGWFYLHCAPEKTWATYHVNNVKSVEISDLYPDSSSNVLVIQTLNSYGERVTVYLNGVTVDMIADAIGCEQMAMQATREEELLA